MAKRNEMIRKAVPVAMAAAMCMGGMLGASAFFTDHASTDKEINAGTLNMSLTDLSDLDSQFGTIDENGDIVTAIKIEDEGYQGTDYTLPAAEDALNQSPGIINPGDNGIYAYKISNTAEKSFDTAKVTKVTVTLGANAKTEDGKTAATLTTADLQAYTIPGLGTPYTSVAADGKSMTLIYASNDSEVLSGSKEEDGKGTTAAYAYNTKFARDLKNKFQDVDVRIDTTVYAKQHRNSVAGSTLSIDTAATSEKDAVQGTYDWSNVGSFEKAFMTQKEKVKAFIDGTGRVNEIFYPCIMFANFDNIVRVGIRYSTIKEAAMAAVSAPDMDAVKEVVEIGNIFIKVVHTEKLLQKDSTVVFNPKFGRYGAFCGGADADIYIDGCLYDFKSTKDIGYHRDYTAQLLGYYFLSRICDDLHEGDLVSQQIKYLGIYRIKVCDIR